MNLFDKINSVWCFKGGGGSSGRVDYPTYLKDMHSQMLCATDSGSADPTISEGSAVDDLIDAAIGNSPWSGFTASVFAPDGAAFPTIGNMESAVSNLNTYLSSVDPNNWDTDIWAEVYGKLSEIWVMESWETMTLDAASDITGALTSPSPDADSDIDTNFADPSPDAPTQIDAVWESPTLDAPSDISGMPVGAEVDDAVDAFADKIDAQLIADVYPRFEAGMRDINAVVSSAFPIGRSRIEEGRNREVADYDGKLRHQAVLNQQSKEMEAHIQVDNLNAQDSLGENRAEAEAYIGRDRINAESVGLKNKLLANAYVEIDKINAAYASQENDLVSKAHLQEDQLNTGYANTINQHKVSEASGRAQSLMQGASEVLKMLQLEAELQKALVNYKVEANRIGIVAKKEEADMETGLAVKDEWWDFEVMERGGNILAAISGTSTVRHGEDPNKLQSALGGAMSGAAMGAMAGGLPGAIAGGVLGAGAGLLG